MRYVITGGSGVIGTALATSLLADGHEVIALSRNPAGRELPRGVHGVKWDARTADGWGEWADGAFAIVNLAGESIGGSGTIPMPGTWSAERKRRIKESRRLAGEAVAVSYTHLCRRVEVGHMGKNIQVMCKLVYIAVKRQ